MTFRTLFVVPAKAGIRGNRWMSTFAGMTKKLFAMLFALVASAHLAFAADAVIVSDIHFNPLADKSLATALMATPAAQWPAILDRGNERMSIYSEDTDWKLLRAALAAMTAQAKPDFVLGPGLSLAHSFPDIFNTSAADHSDAAYRRFVTETMRFLAVELEAT